MIRILILPYQREGAKPGLDHVGIQVDSEEALERNEPMFSASRFACCGAKKRAMLLCRIE